MISKALLTSPSVRVLDAGAAYAAFRQIAELHASEIKHGALPQFGLAVLTSVYRQLALAEQSVVLVVWDGDRVVGFLAGCADVAATFRRVLLKGGPTFLAAFLRQPHLWLVAARFGGSLLMYPFRRKQHAAADQKPASSRGELLAIAVSPDHQGRGIGSALVHEFEAHLRRWRQPSYAVATNAADAASNRFYQKAGFRAVGRTPHHSLTLQNYIKHLNENGDAV